jgi:hypothetical protein
LGRPTGRGHELETSGTRQVEIGAQTGTVVEFNIGRDIDIDCVGCIVLVMDCEIFEEETRFCLVVDCTRVDEANVAIGKIGMDCVDVCEVATFGTKLLEIECGFACAKVCS